MKNRSVLILFPLAVLAFLLLFEFVERRPGLFADSDFLGGILALQLGFVALRHFEVVFFPLLMGTFLLAGSDLPFSEPATSLRWLLLALGALGGFVIWIKNQRAQRFSAFHLIALFCVTSAAVSAAVSDTPRIALMKAASLFLLFLYSSSGARLAVAGKGWQFISGLILACEVLTFFSAVCYFFLGFHVFGNPNALGAIISVAVVPILVWGAVIADTRGVRQRRFFALVICGILLYLANSRASIMAAAVVLVTFTIALRNQRLLAQCALVAVLFVSSMAVINPGHFQELVSTLTGRMLYKDQLSSIQVGASTPGLFGSRSLPWDSTVSAVKRHPWFGSGFGTSDMGNERISQSLSSVYTIEGSNREHGSSYLAMAEYMGLLGSLPFVILLVMLLHTVFRTLGWSRATANPYQLCIPFALIVVAGLIHASFEDWLFAIGSYLSVLFWVAAFLLIDLVPPREWTTEARLSRGRSVFVPSPSPLTPSPAMNSFQHSAR